MSFRPTAEEVAAKSAKNRAAKAETYKMGASTITIVGDKKDKIVGVNVEAPFYYDEIPTNSVNNRSAHVRRIGEANYAVVGPDSAIPIETPAKTIKEKKRRLKAPKKAKPRCPTEHQEQCAVIAWCDTHPLACMIFAIPNGSHKSPATAAKFQREGLRKGYPDLGLDVARNGFHGLRIEMKRVKGSVTSDAQLDWIDFLCSQGYCCYVCHGAEEAIRVIKDYLGE